MSKIYKTIYYMPIKSIKIDTRDNSLKEDNLEQVMYRVICLNNQFLFAEEIATGCIFPCYSWKIEDSKKDIFNMFKEYSYLDYGQYFLLVNEAYPINFGEVVFDEKLLSKCLNCPSTFEVNQYLKAKRKDSRFKARMMEYERANLYMCNLKVIKDEIAKLKGSNYSRDNSYHNYIPVCDIKDIRNFGYDLSTQGELCHAIGRDEELEKVIECTVIKGKSILLIGDAGSGKTAIAEELAREIKLGTNEWLNGKMIISVNTNSLVAGTKYRGMFEENMDKLIHFARENKGKVILFIDEIHTLYKLGTSEKEKNNDAMNILKPYLSNRDIVVIGATTSQEYVDSIVPDTAFCGRFDKINIKELSLELKIDVILEFLDNLRERYCINYNFSDPKALIIKVLDLTDIKHQVSFNEARVSGIRLSKDIFEDAFAHVKFKKRESVEESDVIDAITKCDRISTIVRKQVMMDLQHILGTSKSEQTKTPEKVVSLARIRQNKEKIEQL